MNFNANTQITENTSDYKHITRNEYRNNSANACEALVWSIPQQCRQVAQLSPRDRAAGCVSFGRNIVPLATSVIARHRTGWTRYRAGSRH